MKGRRNMGLVTETVEICITARNVRYYENLGYIIKREKDNRNRIRIIKGQKIKIKTNDLNNHSKIKVSVQCDCCGKIYDCSYASYHNCNRNGLIYCVNCAAKLFNSGENNIRWNFNKTLEEREIGRNIEGYSEFVKRVLSRDNYICQSCGMVISGVIRPIVHHLDGYNWCKEKRLDDTNGITLCENCHSNFHAYYGSGNNTKEQFEEWLGRSVNFLKFDGAIPSTRNIYCYETSQIFKSAKEASRSLNIDKNLIYAACRSKNHYTQGFRFWWYDEFLLLNNDELQNILSLKHFPNRKDKRVICLNTNDILSKCEMCEKYNMTSNQLYRLCSVPNSYFNYYGEPLVFMYYSDYIDKSLQEQKELLKMKLENNTSVLCLNDGMYFYSKIQAGYFYNISHRQYEPISRNLLIDYNLIKQEIQTKLVFVYYKDFIILNQNDRNQLLSLKGG